MKVSISLIAGSSDSTPEQESFRQKQEVEAQWWWDGFYSSNPSKDSPLPAGLCAVLKLKWLDDEKHGRKVCFQLETTGEIRSIDATSRDGTDSLVGPGKTLDTFIGSFENVQVVQP